MNWRMVQVGWIVTLCFSGNSWSQENDPFPVHRPLPSAIRVRSVSSQIRSQLANVQQLIKAERFNRAVVALRNCLNGSESNRLVQFVETADVARHIPLRQAGHRIAADWHKNAPAAFAALQRQLESAAQRRFQNASDGTTADLQQFVDEYWASTSGDTAVLALADRALERGELFSARALLLTLSDRLPAVQARHKRTIFPQTDLKLSPLVARLAWISILSRDPARANREISFLAKEYPAAKGRIGKRQGRLIDILRVLRNTSLTEPTPCESPTFAGSHSRSSRHPQLPRLARRPIWQVSVDVGSTSKTDYLASGRRTAETEQLPLSVHPITSNGTVFFQDHAGVHAIDLFTGKQLWPVRRLDGANLKKSPRRRAGLTRYTISSNRSLLVVRGGSPITGTRHDETNPRSRNSIMLLDQATQGRLVADPIRTPGRDWAFEGTPVHIGGVLYVALRHRQQVRSTLYVAAYDGFSTRQLWMTQIVSAEAPNSGLVDESTHCMLTCAEGRLFVNSGLGAIACLRATDGQVTWLCTYRRRFARTTGLHLLRDLTPPLFHHGRIFVAPTDHPAIFCFDAFDGSLLWRSSPTAVASAIHVLGVIGQRLIVSGNYLYWLDTVTGRLRGQFPARRTTGAELAFHAPRGQGRGVLAGEQIWWPTRDNIYVFSQPTSPGGRSVEPVLIDNLSLTRAGIEGGNLAVARGILLVTSAKRIAAFNAFGRVVQPPRKFR